MINLKQLQLQYVINEAGEKTAIILPIQEFQEIIEDLEDLAAVAERRKELTVSHDQLVDELNFETT